MLEILYNFIGNKRRTTDHSFGGAAITRNTKSSLIGHLKNNDRARIASRRPLSSGINYIKSPLLSVLKISTSPKHTIQHKSPSFSCMRIKTSPRPTFLTCYVAQPYPFQLCWPPLSTWRWFFLLSPAPVFSRPVYLSALLLSVAISCYLPNAPHPHSLQLPGKKYVDGVAWSPTIQGDRHFCFIQNWGPFGGAVCLAN